MNPVKVVFFILIATISARSQSFFKASAVLGTNISQIDGDELAGYHKYGITAGAKVEFPLSSALDAGLEFLYSQRGSRTSIYNNFFDQTYRLHLEYISLPVFIKWNDWWVEDDAYYKVSLHGGVSNGYLIRNDVEESFVILDGPLRNHDLSYFLGGGFAFTKRWVLTMRYNRSVIPMYKKDPGGGRDIRRFVGYFLTLRSEYNF